MEFAGGTREVRKWGVASGEVRMVNGKLSPCTFTRVNSMAGCYFTQPA